MFQSVISGFFFFLITIFLGPALLIAGFQLLGGQKIRLPSIMKPLGKTVFALAQLLFETVNVVANMVAERCPPRYRHWQPIVKPVVAFVLVAAVVWRVLNLLLSLADR